MHREGVRQAAAVEDRQRRSFEAGRVRPQSRCGPRDSRAVAKTCTRGRRTFTPNRPELPVERRVARRVGEQIVELVVLVDSPECGRRGRSSARRGSRRYPRASRARPGPRVEPQRVLDPLERHRQRLLRPVRADGELAEPILDEAIHLPLQRRGRRPGAQAVGIDRIGRHVGAIGRVDDGVELRGQRRRHRESFRKEHDRLAAGHGRRATRRRRGGRRTML